MKIDSHAVNRFQCALLVSYHFRDPLLRRFLGAVDRAAMLEAGMGGDDEVLEQALDALGLCETPDAAAAYLIQAAAGIAAEAERVGDLAKSMPMSVLNPNGICDLMADWSTLCLVADGFLQAADDVWRQHAIAISQALEPAAESETGVMDQ
jgi:hypothetical protein